MTLATVLIAFLAYGFLTQPGPQPLESSGFSSARVVEDLKVISADNHSVIHPENRAVVRDFLAGRLEELGAEPVLYHYDSLEARGMTFDVTNILAEFPPKKEMSDTTYLMLVAHYDSRYSEPFLKDTTECSYGAADDGYGIGVILECVNQTLKSREYWHQGIKVLFTDAEEPGMWGMKSIYENNHEVFDNVGLLINVEARGPWGPALLFETGTGNSKVMDLYSKEAKSPYTYSLTTTVYKIMPNFTDFSVVKDEIPGLNFSTVADINHYHNELDNIDNISEKSIQHYGAQILPVVNKYITSEDYAKTDALVSNEDSIFYTVPGLGLIKYSNKTNIILGIIFAILTILLIVFETLRGKVTLDKVGANFLTILLAGVFVFGVGELVAYISAVAAGVPFRLFGTVRGIMGDNIIMLVSVIVVTIIAMIVYLKFRSDAIKVAQNSMRASAAIMAIRRHAYRSLYGVMLLFALLEVILLFVIGDNFMFFVPLFMAFLGILMYNMTKCKFFLLAGMAFIMLHAFSFYYALAMALTIGALGAILMLAFFDIMLLIPMADLYLTSDKR